MISKPLPGSDAETGGPAGSYFGGKGAAGTYQTLINQIPPHDLYVAPFLGYCSILRRKRPARASVGCELDPETLKAWAGARIPGLRIYRTDGIAWLRHHFELDRFDLMAPRSGEAATSVPLDTEARTSPRDPAARAAFHTFIFADPPYPHSTRSADRYRFEMTDERHRELLQVLRSVDAMVMVCSYPNELYDELLGDWRTFTYQNSTRGGPVIEQAWCNYPEPIELHDSRYIGCDRRERERIRRRCRNWKRELDRLPPLERQAILDEIHREAVTWNGQPKKTDSR